MPDDVTVTTMQRALLAEIGRLFDDGVDVTYVALAEVLGVGLRAARYSVQPLRDLGLVETERGADSEGCRVSLSLTTAGRATLASPPTATLGWGVGVARSNADPEALAHARTWEPDVDGLLGRRQILEQLAYEDDDLTQVFVSEHPEGATCEQIADLLGLSRERVRQILETALDRLARRGYLACLHHYVEAA